MTKLTTNYRGISLYLFITRVMKLTVVITKECQCY